MKKLFQIVFLITISIGVAPCFASDLDRKLLRIGFDGVSTINSPTRFLKKRIHEAFPGFNIVESEVYTYGKSRYGFHLYSGVGQDLVYEIYPMSEEDYIFAVFTNSPLVEGPSKSRVGVTKLKELKDLPEWASCGWGRNALKNTYICYGSGVRVLFVAPLGFESEFSKAPQGVVDNGVLSEIMYWPGRP